MAEAPKTKAKAVKRTDEDLKKTLNGKLTILVSAAFQLANEKDRAGLTSVAVKDAEGKDIPVDAQKKSLSFKVNNVIGPKGSIASLSETDPNMVALVAAAKKAQPDLMKSVYSPSVIALLNFCLDKLAVKEKKKRGFDPKRLEGITL